MTLILNKLFKLYVPVGVLLLIYSPIIFLFCNSILLFILIYYKTKLWELFRVNVFLLLVWIFLFTSYMYLLTQEPSVPLYYGDSVILNPENFILIVKYSIDFPSISRSTFLETLLILQIMSSVLGVGGYPTLFFFV